MAPKIFPLLAAGMLFVVLPTASADPSEETNCATSEVKVCFADGECFCKVRSVEPSDTPDNYSNCVDENDTGVCS